MVSAIEMLATCNASISKDSQKEQFLVQLHFLELRDNCDTLGCLKEAYGGREALVTSGSIEEEVLDTVHENPHNSTKSTAQQVGTSQFSAVKILKKNKFHPYHLQLYQDLHGTDFGN
jgi:hypothetical protein